MAAGLRWLGKCLQFPRGIVEGHRLQTVCHLIHLSTARHGTTRHDTAQHYTTRYDTIAMIHYAMV